MHELRKEIEENTLLMIQAIIGTELNEEQLNGVKDAIKFNSNKICIEFSKELGNVMTAIVIEHTCKMGNINGIEDHCERILKHHKEINSRWYLDDQIASIQSNVAHCVC